jgi:hypothetical protein
MQSTITNQPFSFAAHRRSRRSYLPSHSRTNPYMETPHDHRD